MRLLKLSLLTIALVAPAAGATAQNVTVPTSLTLEDAIRLAKQNNPGYLLALNSRRRAEHAISPAATGARR